MLILGKEIVYYHSIMLPNCYVLKWIYKTCITMSQYRPILISFVILYGINLVVGYFHYDDIDELIRDLIAKEHQKRQVVQGIINNSS